MSISKHLACLFCCAALWSTVHAQLNIKAVNLGGWLVTEGWIKPSLFDGIANKDFLDGTEVKLKSVYLGKYVCAENGGASVLVANRGSASGWESFRLWRVNETSFYMRVFNKQFIGYDSDGDKIRMLTYATTPTIPQLLTIFKNPAGGDLVRILSSNGKFLQAKTQDLVTADNTDMVSQWGNSDPSVFELTITKQMQGEFQVTNGYGSRAAQVMNDHWNSYIVQDDFRFIASHGLNAVRIPVGWWIASDPSPPKPYVGGSLAALDRAFQWAQKYKLKVIIDLHAADGSQNGNDHSSSRDGTQDWGKSDTNIQRTVDVIEFLTKRYAASPSLFAVELLNEPVAPGVTLDMVNKYYKAGYDAVRRHSSSAYVILSQRLGLGSQDEKELFPLASGLQKSVIDVHYYNLFWPEVFNSMTVQQNIDFINTNRSAQLNAINTQTGPLVLVGEWVAEWMVSGAAKADVQRFAAAQLDVYGRASFGWAYWTYKNVNDHWSLQWMISNGYITL
ncbi:unnamed protein product [Rhodiola kirilowii]